MTATEYVASERPFIVRRVVKWGDCDPAGVVYTVTFSEYVISVAELFYGSLFGSTGQKAKDELGFGTPSRALSFDFRRSLRPDDVMELNVHVGEVRQRSYELLITANCEGELAFIAKLTPICVARSERRGIEIPPALREALMSYRAQCPAPSHLAQE